MIPLLPQPMLNDFDADSWVTQASRFKEATEAWVIVCKEIIAANVAIAKTQSFTFIEGRHAYPPITSNTLPTTPVPDATVTAPVDAVDYHGPNKCES